ncbi:MAG: hypothetical protein Q9224_006148 [Gallowayella concinna]
MVTLEVGHEGDKFHVHKSLICHVSPFFVAALNGPFKESSGSMELGEDEVDTIEHLIQWLYGGEIDIAPLADPQCFESRYTKLTRLYILADKYDIVSLKNDVMHLLFATIKQPDGTFRRLLGANSGRVRPSTDKIIYVYANTVRGSLLRKFLISYWAWHRGLSALEDEETWDKLEPCPEFAFEMARALASLANGRPDPLLDITNFFEPTPDSAKP